MSRRAPSGAVALARQVSRLAKEVGRPAAANALGISPRGLGRLLNAQAKGNIGKAFHTTATLEKWQGRLTVARGNVTGEILKAIDGKGASAGFSEAATSIGKAAQGVMGNLHAAFTDTQLAKAAGVSRQKITAERIKIAKGKADGDTLARWRDLKDTLDNRTRVKDGIVIVSKEVAARYTEGGAKARGKHFTSWDEVKKWINEVTAGARGYVRVVNNGTAADPDYDVLFGDSDTFGDIDNEMDDAAEVDGAND